MNKICLWSIVIFCLVSVAALAGLVTLYFVWDNDTETKFADFGSDFRFGAASSSYQIEGAWNESGKSVNIWDKLVHDSPEKITNSDNGDVAADSYHLYKEDVKAIKETGLDFYRFSISWSRILPDGAETNQAGIDYYNNLINELIEHGIEPMVTMYHWDLPQYIQDLGGWTNEIIVDYFDHYSDVLYANFGDRVKKWVTVNEPYIFCTRGYGSGVHAPSIESPGLGEYHCGHNVLLAHAKAYHNYEDKYKRSQNGEVGICLYTEFYYPDEAAYADLAVQGVQHILGWFAHPIFSHEGNYPKVMIDNIKRNSDSEGRLWSRLPEFTAEEIEYINGTSDFLALNYYTSRLVKPQGEHPEEYEFDWQSDAGFEKIIDPSWPKGKSDFLYSVPDGLRDVLVWIKDQYHNPIVLITENGYSDEGQLQDDDRITYIKDHLYAIRDANAEGCQVKAYTVWSIIDNFEWLAGYGDRFGIYHVNFTAESKVRTAKKSSVFLNEVIKTRMIEERDE